MYKNLSIYTDREVPSKFYSKIENFLLKIFPFTGIKIENPIETRIQLPNNPVKKLKKLPIVNIPR